MTYTPRDITRFWKFVHIPVPDFNCCWVWVGCAKRGKGYASFWLQGRNIKASRFSFKLANGWLPIDKQVCHICDNRICVNPNHLFIGTNQDNVTDKMNKGRYITTPGEKNGSSKLTTDEVLHIRTLKESGISAKDLSQWFHVSESTIYNIYAGRQWKHV